MEKEGKEDVSYFLSLPEETKQLETQGEEKGRRSALYYYFSMGRGKEI